MFKQVLDHSVLMASIDQLHNLLPNFNGTVPVRLAMTTSDSVTGSDGPQNELMHTNTRLLKLLC